MKNRLVFTHIRKALPSLQFGVLYAVVAGTVHYFGLI
jgi:hypothetical protein